ncbi:Uncharacterized protein Adt_40935 [Abeliophyllum distichum]|uniref:Retrovirus-related Pol polyprotein from transposon TNT 1-94-like beta-barrel domain-containing protein n=1 Tax=Abeliophyllum distichum TaxID=126358 RepID=A0ABD1PQ38_9LAMI
MTGHIVDTCYFIHGFPPGHKFHGKDVKSRNKRFTNADIVHTLDPNKGKTLTAKEYEQIMALLNNKTGNDKPHINTSGINSSTTSLSNSWIINSGATDHVTKDGIVENKSMAKHKTVQLPDGCHALIKSVGAVDLGNNMIVGDVLHVPNFKVNLLSINSSINKSFTFSKFSAWVWIPASASSRVWSGTVILKSKAFAVSCFWMVRTSVKDVRMFKVFLLVVE